MKDLYQSTSTSEYSSETPGDNSSIGIVNSAFSEAGPSSRRLHKPTLWSGFLVSAFSLFENSSEPKSTNRLCNSKSYVWASAVKRMMNSSSMRRIFGLNKTGFPCSKGEIWLLGICYKIAEEDSTDPAQSEGFASFVDDFSSRILITYRKGFAPIEDSKYTSDVNWGCMVRSSQMLIAQAYLFHLLGRSWRKSMNTPVEQNYCEILHLFGDSKSSPYSIHNLLRAGKPYGLSPGSWVGPYAMCRTWEALSRNQKESFIGDLVSSISIYIVSGDEDGERGGAPMLCIEDINKHCIEHSSGQADWAPIVLLVPLVLGLDKVNPRYLPLLGATFCFPQSLGILGGRPGASTYIIGIQDDNAFYLDPHEVQQVVDVMKGNLEGDISSYHSNTVKQFPLDSIDPSLAIGFYCRDKSDFDDFCSRASELADKSNGAPLFTIVQTRKSSYSVNFHANVNDVGEFSHLGTSEGGLRVGESEVDSPQEDDWQLL